MKLTGNRIVMVLVLVALAIYLGEYGNMRIAHDFVRDGTTYTDSDGKTVHTDRIRLGEWRYGPVYWFLNKIYWPVRTIEGLLWRAYHASRDGGRVGFSDGPS